MHINEQMIVTAIRGNRAYLPKQRHQPKPRRGVYGKNLDDSIARLAKGLGVNAEAVRPHVMHLMSEGRVAFVKNRLLVATDKPAAFKRTATTPAPQMIITAAPSLEDRYEHVKPYLLRAFADLFAAETAAA